MSNRPDLETDIYRNPEFVARIRQSNDLATDLYRALCNNRFLHTSQMNDDDPWYWSCTWRGAGALVAEIVGTNPDPMNYCDYYCAGGEGTITPEIADILASMGWHGRPYKD